MAFQGSIAEIVQRLENYAGRMSSASHGLASISSDANVRAEASAQSTGRASEHVDRGRDLDQATSRRVLTSVADEAEKTSTVAAATRSWWKRRAAMPPR